MFGIIKCPICGEIQGVETRYRTTACRKCGKRIEVAKTGLLGTFDDQKSMRKAIWDMKSSKMESEEIDLRDEMIRDVGPARKRDLNRQGKEDLLISVIEKGTEDIDLILEKMITYDICEDEVVAILRSLQKKNLIYSPRYNIFRSVQVEDQFHADKSSTNSVLR